MITTIKFIKLNQMAQAPTRGSKYAAGYDLSAAITSNVMIAPHTTVKIGTGIAAELPDNTFGAIYARSGIASKEGLRPANCTGVVDSDYRGEIVVALHNDSDVMRMVEPGERIAQLVVQPYVSVEFEEVETLNTTDRGSSGFGSTGK
jgi:dUTP pyrophosphatase